MKCPHCLVDFNDQQTFWSVNVGNDASNWWVFTRRHSPTCGRFVFRLENGDGPTSTVQGSIGTWLSVVRRTIPVWPKVVARAPIPGEVPLSIAGDYEEACLVLADSPKASAALSRRCLQNLLRQAAGVKPGNLAGEIQQVLDSGKLPSSLAESVDAVRAIGNFAAHAIKSQSTGEIVEVEPHEAEWNLNVLESLFDFYYVLPAKAKAKKDALNKKMSEAGKPPVK